MSTLKEPYRVEGKKTLGYELAEQLDWELPDVFFYPTGGSTGLIGMWKAFDEMEILGWIGKNGCGCFPSKQRGALPSSEHSKRAKPPRSSFQVRRPVLRDFVCRTAVGDFLILSITAQILRRWFDSRGRNHDSSQSRSRLDGGSLRRARGCSVLRRLEVALLVGENRARRARCYFQHWLRNQILGMLRKREVGDFINRIRIFTKLSREAFAALISLDRGFHLPIGHSFVECP